MSDSQKPIVLAEGKYFRMLNKAGWEYITPNCFHGVVLIIPITDDGKIVLIEQYRPPVDSIVVELPAGLVGDEPHAKQESFIEAADRELIEETGFKANNLEILTTGAPSPGSNSVILHFIKATGLEKVSAGGGVSTENIEIFEVPLNQIKDFLDKRIALGHIVDLKVYTGLCLIGQSLN